MDNIKKWQEEFRDYVNSLCLPKDDHDGIMEYISEVPSAEPDIARDIATIIENEKDMRVILKNAQPEQSPEIQDILNYLDTVLHPIISPEHWDVYSELHDMISTLPSSEPRPRGRWINHRKDRGHNIADCDQCGGTLQWLDPDERPNFCPDCGADMREEEQDG